MAHRPISFRQGISRVTFIVRHPILDRLGYRSTLLRRLSTGPWSPPAFIALIASFVAPGDQLERAKPGGMLINVGDDHQLIRTGLGDKSIDSGTDRVG